MSAPIVIKYGGHAMADEALRHSFAEDVARLRGEGSQPVIVHGGGPQIDGLLGKLGIESARIAGMRVTTPQIMDVVRMVLTGQVGPDIVGLLNAHGPLAVGLSGEDANLFTAERRQAVVDGQQVDLGQVGEITKVDTSVVRSLLGDGRIPVIAGVARGTGGEIYNVNADLAASALAASLGAAEMIMLTDVPGLYASWPEGELISRLTAAELEKLLPDLAGGMAPKMEACLRAVRGGVRRARVLDGRMPGALHDERPGGTEIVPDDLPKLAHADSRARFTSAMMPTYGTPPLTLVRGAGCRVWDAGGNEYLDLIGGIAVSSLGHAHPTLVRAVSAQVAKLAHTSNLFVNEPAAELAARLPGLLGADARVFLCNSGAEANEVAYKIVRKRGGRRPYIVAAEGSFHGRTMGALALTGKPAIREPFGPYGADVRFVPYGDADALLEAVTGECAAVFLEPIQGEGGVVPAPPDYLWTARAACDATGALLVLDEIQTGVGRTGDWFAHTGAGVRPDLLTLAKGLGGGLPIGACVAVGPYGEILGKGDHGSTFGGNPVAAAAALAVLSTIERDDLLTNAATVGERLAGAITGHPLVSDVRGRGLLLGIALTRPLSGAAEAAARQAGFLVNALRPDVLRLAPPLILTADEADSFARALPAILDTAGEST